MAVPDTSARIAEAQKLAKLDATKAEQIFKDVLSRDPGSNETAIKNYESALVGLGELYRDQKRVDALAELVTQARSIMSSFAKAKTSKLGRLKIWYQQEGNTNFV
jgi:26S proteasome regulatory subunit N6